MAFILDVDDAPSVLAASNRSSSHDDVLLRADDSERNEVFDFAVSCALLTVLLVVVVGVHAEIMESEFFFDPLLKGHAFF